MSWRKCSSWNRDKLRYLSVGHAGRSTLLEVALWRVKSKLVQPQAILAMWRCRDWHVLLSHRGELYLHTVRKNKSTVWKQECVGEFHNYSRTTVAYSVVNRDAR
jgi:hypothetical protein